MFTSNVRNEKSDYPPGQTHQFMKCTKNGVQNKKHTVQGFGASNAFLMWEVKGELTVWLELVGNLHELI